MKFEMQDYIKQKGCVAFGTGHPSTWIYRITFFSSDFRAQIITSKQKASIKVQESKKEVLNFCANNYLGLADHPELIQAAKDVCVF